MKDVYEVFNDSFERLVTYGQGVLFDRFYECFIRSDERIKALFSNTDMTRQKAMLQESIFHVLNFAITGKVSEHFAKLRDRHQQMGIDDQMYDLWMESLLASVKHCDPKFNQQVLAAWQQVMNAGLHFMKQPK